MTSMFLTTTTTAAAMAMAMAMAMVTVTVTAMTLLLSRRVVVIPSVVWSSWWNVESWSLCPLLEVGTSHHQAHYQVHCLACGMWMVMEFMLHKEIYCLLSIGVFHVFQVLVLLQVLPQPHPSRHPHAHELL
jgi:hypothetical protein